jgi:hypothetical protein
MSAGVIASGAFDGLVLDASGAALPSRAAGAGETALPEPDALDTAQQPIQSKSPSAVPARAVRSGRFLGELLAMVIATPDSRSVTK